jgi:hypothetical protein
MEVRMDRFGKPLERRKFLKKGITGGAMIAAFPVWKSVNPRQDYSPNESHRRLLKIVQKYGGEFGDTRGGL